MKTWKVCQKVLFCFFIIFSFVGCESKNDSNDSTNKNEGRLPSNSKPDQEPSPTPVPQPQPIPSPEPDPEPIPDEELTSCEKLCGEDEVLFDREDNGYSYLAFANFGYLGVGRCRGHALTTQRFSYLARFTPGGGCDLKDDACLSAIKKGIDKIQNYLPYTFKGFYNLYEFSQVESLKEYLKGFVRRTSHRYRAVDGHIENTSYGSPHANTFFELKRRVELNQLPYVGVTGKLTGSHALLIYNTQFIQGREVLCARDSNIVLGRPETCDDFVYLENGQVFYKRADRAADYLRFFKITSDEDDRVVKYRSALKRACIKKQRTANNCK